MSPTESDIFSRWGVLKKAVACGFFGVFAEAVAVPAVAVLAVAVPTCSPAHLLYMVSITLPAVLALPALLNIILIIEQHLSTNCARSSWPRKIGRDRGSIWSPLVQWAKVSRREREKVNWFQN